MEFFELEGSVEPIDEFMEENEASEGDSRTILRQQLNEGDQVYSQAENSVTIKLPDNNELVLTFFEDETCASFFAEYCKLKY